MKNGSRRIVYQNKDVTAKSLAEQFKGKSFSVYGIDVPEIVGIEPTNLPDVEVNELRLDNLFLLSDGSYAIVDYESEYSEANKQKYIDYVARVSRRLYNEYGEYKKIRIIIIYTADVKKGTTKSSVDMDGLKLSITEAFLIDQDSENIYKELSQEIEKSGKLGDESMMKLIIYPLTFKGKQGKRTAIKQALDLAEQIYSEKQRRFVAQYILAFTDKVIGDREAERIRRILMLTKVEQIIENEKQAAVEKAVKETQKEARKKARQTMAVVVERLLRSGTSANVVSECTGVSMKEVQRIENKILKEA